MNTKIASQVRINDVLWEKLKAIADKELRSVNNQVEYFLGQSVSQYEEQHGAIEVSPPPKSPLI